MQAQGRIFVEKGRSSTGSRWVAPSRTPNGAVTSLGG